MIGVVHAMAMVGVGILAIWTSWSMDFGTDRFAALWTLLGVGFGIALLACILATVNRSWLGRIPLLLVGILALWAGLLLGSDLYFRVWQAMPNPPDQAYSDSGPSLLVIAGWIPGTIGVSLLFLPCWLVIGLIRRRTDHRGESDHSRAVEPIVSNIPPTASPDTDRGS